MIDPRLQFEAALEPKRLALEQVSGNRAEAKALLEWGKQFRYATLEIVDALIACYSAGIKLEEGKEIVADCYKEVISRPGRNDVVGAVRREVMKRQPRLSGDDLRSFFQKAV